MSYERPWVGKRRNFNAQNVIAIAAAVAVAVSPAAAAIMAAAPTEAMGGVWAREL